MMKTALAYAGFIALAAAIPTRDQPLTSALAPCSSYTLINTRGTLEPQGESSAFVVMNTNVHRQRPGGQTYNTIYPADLDQNSTAGTEDIVNHIHSTLTSNASECFILEGYSQGAAATVDVFRRLNGNAAAAVKGIVLLGNPDHKGGLACNVDMAGGNSTRDVDGLFALGGISEGIPESWVSKTLDVCNYGDGVCDTKHGEGITEQHFAYIGDDGTQNMGTKFILQKLQSNSTGYWAGIGRGR